MVHWFVNYTLGMCGYVCCASAYYGMHEKASLCQVLCAITYVFVSSSVMILWWLCQVKVVRQFMDLPEHFIKRDFGNTGHQTLLRATIVGIGVCVTESVTKQMDSATQHANNHEQAIHVNSMHEQAKLDLKELSGADRSKALAIEHKQFLGHQQHNEAMRNWPPKGTLQKTWESAISYQQTANMGAAISKTGEVLGSILGYGGKTKLFVFGLWCVVLLLT